MATNNCLASCCRIEKARVDIRHEIVAFGEIFRRCGHLVRLTDLQHKPHSDRHVPFCGERKVKVAD